MSKMAIFAEGRTEVEFNCKLIHALAQPRAITIESRVISGSRAKRKSTQIAVLQTDGTRPSSHFFMIYNCRSDDSVKLRMMEEYDNLVRAGYKRILCHRDVSPTFSHDEIDKLERGLPKYVKTLPIKVTFVLSVMAIEAWFLGEYLHFPLIDPRITVEEIIDKLSFDPRGDVQRRPTPCDDLKACYALGGKMYDKWNTQPTINALDFAHVALGMVDRFPHLSVLCNEITTFLDS